MNITSKSRYAIKILMDLAEHWQRGDGEVVQRNDLALRQGIPLDYMDHILSRLRDAQLIGSTRGRTGGYRLARNPAEVSVLEIFTAVEDAFQPVQCLEGGTGCVSEHVCSAKDAWGLISNAISGALSGIILEDLVHQRGIAKGLEAFGAAKGVEARGGMQECRAPKRRVGGSH